MSPTQRTLRLLREQGYRTALVERWVPRPDLPGGGHKLDLFGCFDLLAIRPGEIIAVQSTGTDHAGHRRKLIERREAVLAWLEAGGRAQLISWRLLLVKRGGKARRYQPRVEEITPQTFAADRQEGDT